MRVLVIGKGGREHAMVKALAMSPTVQELHAVPGSAGMSSEALCHDINPSDTEKLTAFCDRTSIDLVVIGPEQPLIDGVSDALRKKGIAVFGPSQQAAQLEGSKIFAKTFMEKSGVPTARYKVVDSVASVEQAMAAFEAPYVLKADGLAAGKGVSICQSAAELLVAAKELFEDKKFGEAGSKALLEEFQPGTELSVFVLTNGTQFQLLPFAQDHKRLKDNNQGPNTGGMGAFAPLDISESIQQQIIEQVVVPSVNGLSQNLLDYRGVLYIGVMQTEQGPKVIEYNVRFGDPEAQVLFPMLDGDWAKSFHAIAIGDCPVLSFRKIAVGCVVMAAQGYPDAPVNGATLGGDPLAGTSTSYYIHAGTKQDSSGTWQTAGGRVLNAIGIAGDVDAAIQNAYKQVEYSGWDGMQVRGDIGKYRP